MQELTESNFNEEIASDGVLVYFSSPTCGPCRRQYPIMEELQDAVRIVKVDVDAYFELSQKWKVAGLPTVIAFKDGVEVDRTMGLTPKTRIEQMIKKIN